MTPAERIAAALFEHQGWKHDGAPEAKVTLGTENNLINLTPMLGTSELCLLVDSGELRYGFVNIRWVEIA